MRLQKKPKFLAPFKLRLHKQIYLVSWVALLIIAITTEFIHSGYKYYIFTDFKVIFKKLTENWILSQDYKTCTEIIYC